LRAALEPVHSFTLETGKSLRVRRA